jgi:hypothetical protein
MANRIATTMQGQGPLLEVPFSRQIGRTLCSISNPLVTSKLLICGKVNLRAAPNDQSADRESSYGRIVGDEERTRSTHFFSVPCRNRPLSFDIGLSAGLHRAFLPSTIDPMELPLSCTNNLRDWEAARVTALSLRKLCNGNGIVIGSLDHRYVTPLRGEGCVS